jgi:hypothetical protein
MAKARKMRLFARRKIKTKKTKNFMLKISPQKPEMMWGGRVFYLRG